MAVSKWCLVASALVLSFAASPAFAGYKVEDPLEVWRWNVDFGFGELVVVSGSLGSVRHAEGYYNRDGKYVDGSSDQLGCQVNVRRVVEPAGWRYEKWVDCWAWSKEWEATTGHGNGWVSCTSDRPEFVEAVNSMTSDSNIRFVLEDDLTEENPYYAYYNGLELGYGRCIDLRIANASFTPPKRLK